MHLKNIKTGLFLFTDFNIKNGRKKQHFGILVFLYLKKCKKYFSYIKNAVYAEEMMNDQTLKIVCEILY